MYKDAVSQRRHLHLHTEIKMYTKGKESLIGGSIQVGIGQRCLTFSVYNKKI